jgi:predicted RNA-binding Zn-ribbon protein involved in translation (DUF1610 family)
MNNNPDPHQDLHQICADFIELSNKIAVALTVEDQTECILALTRKCHDARLALVRASSPTWSPHAKCQFCGFTINLDDFVQLCPKCGNDRWYRTNILQEPTE